MLSPEAWLQRIPFTEFTFEVSRSRGPGGQNVNKTNSAVVLRWTPAATVALSQLEREKILPRLESKLTVGGELLIRSEVHRDQDQNKKDCLRKLGEMLAQAAFTPKARKKTKPTRSSQRRRVEGKKQRAEVKQGRQRVRV